VGGGGGGVNPQWRWGGGGTEFGCNGDNGVGGER
jgi:hypothetical protein